MSRSHLSNSQIKLFYFSRDSIFICAAITEYPQTSKDEKLHFYWEVQDHHGDCSRVWQGLALRSTAMPVAEYSHDQRQSGNGRGRVLTWLKWKGRAPPRSPFHIPSRGDRPSWCHYSLRGHLPMPLLGSEFQPGDFARTHANRDQRAIHEVSQSPLLGPIGQGKMREISQSRG